MDGLKSSHGVFGDILFRSFGGMAWLAWKGLKDVNFGAKVHMVGQLEMG